MFALPVLHVTGLLVAGLGLSMLLPTLIDLTAGNPDWKVFVASAIITWTFGTLLALATRRPDKMRISVRQAFAMTTSAWIALSVFAALPFLGLGLDYDDSLFEAVSGLTTTGSTVISGLDRLPPGVLFWRALLQWIGGVGIVVMAIIILPFLRVGGMQLFHAESSDRSEKVVPRPFHFVGYIAGAYLVLTLGAAIGYGSTGMKPFDAICHAMTTVSTGGFANTDASFGAYSAATQWISVFFMIAGALPFVAYIKSVKGQPIALWNDAQVRVLMGFLFILCVVVGIWLSFRADLSVHDGMRLATFNIVSIVTTTGYASADYTLWGPPAVGLFFLITFIGGCAGSTSGGIKIYRFQVLRRVALAYMRRLSRPNRVISLRYAGRSLPQDVPTSVLAFLAIYIGTTAIVTLALAMMGLDLVTAVSSAAQAISNVGPGLGAIVGPVGNFASLPDGAKWLLSAAMLLGRLELFTVIVMFDPDFWRN